MASNVLADTMGHELRRRITTERVGALEVPVGVELDDVEIADAGGVCSLTPEIEGSLRVRHALDAVDQEKRSTVDSDVARVRERPHEIVDVATVVFEVVGLLDEHLVGTGIPRVCPVLVSPREAEGEGRLTALEHLLERPLQNLASLEPIVVVAEAFDPVAASELRLQSADFGDPQVVEAKLAWHVRLSMAFEQRMRLRHIPPFREAARPPGVVLGRWVEIEGDRTR